MNKSTKIASILLLLTFFAQNVVAEPEADQLTVGQSFPIYKFEDPFGKPQVIKDDTKFVLISFEMELSKSMHTWLSEKDADFLEKHNVQYIADITEMPAIISYLFGKPKMRKYKFPILLADDENFEKRFPKEEGKFVVFKLGENKEIEDVTFFSDMESLSAKYLSEDKDTKPAAEETTDKS